MTHCTGKTLLEVYSVGKCLVKAINISGALVILCEALNIKIWRLNRDLLIIITLV